MRNPKEMSQCQWLRVPALSQPGVGWEPPNSRTVVRLGQFKDVKRSAAFAEGVPGCCRMFHAVNSVCSGLNIASNDVRKQQQP